MYIYIFPFCHIAVVSIPLRAKPEDDTIRMQNNNASDPRLNKESDNPDLMSDEFDSDSKENDKVSSFCNR